MVITAFPVSVPDVSRAEECPSVSVKLTVVIVPSVVLNRTVEPAIIGLEYLSYTQTSMSEPVAPSAGIVESETVMSILAAGPGSILKFSDAVSDVSPVAVVA